MHAQSQRHTDKPHTCPQARPRSTLRSRVRCGAATALAPRGAPSAAGGGLGRSPARSPPDPSKAALPSPHPTAAAQRAGRRARASLSVTSRFFSSRLMLERRNTQPGFTSGCATYTLNLCAPGGVRVSAKARLRWAPLPQHAQPQQAQGARSEPRTKASSKRTPRRPSANTARDARRAAPH